MRQIDIRVAGVPLSLACLYGDVQMSTATQGPDELSWSSSDIPANLSSGGLLVEGYYGPDRIWYGTSLEPDPSQTQQVAQGLWHLADTTPALTSGGAAGNGPDQSIDQAIIRGALRGWSRPTSLQSTAVDIDISSGPVSIGALLDAMAETAGKRWGVDADGIAFMKADDTSPTYRTLPIEGGLGLAMDDYASVLIGRYYDSTSSTYLTRTVSDPAPVSNVYQEKIVDLTPRGPISAAKADTILTSLFTLGGVRPKFTTSIDFNYGEILTIGGSAVALETVKAGPVMRVYGGTDLARANLGLMWVDIPIGQTSLSDGLITVQPLQTAARSFEDVLVRALKKK